MPSVEMPEEEVKQEVEVTEDTPDDVLNELMNDLDIPINDDIINVTERVVPGEDDVFDEPPTVEVAKEEDVSSEYVDPTEPKGKRAYKRKQPMSQKQKDHLARIRKIAQEKRAKQKELKESEKEEAQLKKVEERLLKKKQKEESASVKESPVAPAQPRQQQQKMYTEEDLNRAILAGVSTYDTYRKQQKKEKKTKEAEDAKQRKMNETIQRAIAPQQNTADPWRSLFG